MHIPIPAGEEGAGDTDFPGEDRMGLLRDTKHRLHPIPTQAGAFYPPQQAEQGWEFSLSSSDAFGPRSILELHRSHVATGFKADSRCLTQGMWKSALNGI